MDFQFFKDFIMKLDWNTIIVSIIAAIAAASIVLKIKNINLNFFTKNSYTNIENSSDLDIEKFKPKIKEEVINYTSEIFSKNFTNIQNIAKKTSEERAHELIKDFSNEILKKDNSEIKAFLNRLQTPSMQIAIYKSQKIYAISGNINKKNILIDLLIKKSSTDEDSLTDIKIDIAINTMTKITTKQIDFMTLFLTVYFGGGDFKNIEEFKNYVVKFIKPFLYIVKIDINNAIHLEEIGLLTAFIDQHYLKAEYNLRYNFKFLQQYSEERIRNILLETDEEFIKLDYLYKTQFFRMNNIAEIICKANIKNKTGEDFSIYYSE